MPDSPDTEISEAADARSGRGLRVIMALLALIFVPAGIYGVYVLGQLDDIREHNLRGLDNAARAVEGLLENARKSVANLGEDPDYACKFFERQTRLELVSPDCELLSGVLAEDPLAIDIGNLRFEPTAGTLEIVGRLVRQRKNGASTEQVTREGTPEIRIRVLLGALLEQIPFGAPFEQLLIVDDAGALLGTAVSPQRSSPMLPPRVTLATIAPSVRAFDLSDLRFAGSTKDAPISFKSFGATTFVHSVTLAGKRYTLMCQPSQVALDATSVDATTWRLCGLVDSQQSFRQALEVAPHIVVLLLVLLTLAVVSWPILKVLSLAPRERIRFADMYLMLLATLTLTMLLSVGVADIGTYRHLRDMSRDRLKDLALDIESSLRGELTAMHAQLAAYDLELQQQADQLGPVRGEKFELGSAIRISCLLLAPADPHQKQCVNQNAPEGLSLSVPSEYPSFQLVFWMRPEDGRQALKGTVEAQSTPAVQLESRDYFRMVRRGRTWSMQDAGINAFFVETSASVTTGEFFAALSMPSALETADPDGEPFVAALSGQLVSIRYPVLAPGVGFAIADRNGHVVFHSDERRAATEELFADDGIAARLRAVFASDADAEFYAHYQTRPHQIHVHQMRDLPWAVMTFADDEVLRSLHVELLARTGILVTLYLLLAFLGTLLYMLFHGREPPVWVWPRRDRRYREIYAVAVWSLAAQLIVVLLTLDFLRGELLVLASLVLPLPALATVVIADRAAQRLCEPLPEKQLFAAHASDVVLRQMRHSGLAILASVVLAAATMLAMTFWDTAAAAFHWAGLETTLLCVLLVVLMAAALAGTARARAALEMLRVRTADSTWIRWWWEPLTPHVTGTVIVWLLLGALPAYALFKYALSSQMTILTQAEQSYLARSFAWRECRVEDDLRLIATADGPDRSVSIRERLQMSTAAQGYGDIYERARLARPGEPRDDHRLTEPGYAADFWTDLANLAPVYNDATTYSRYLDPFVTSETGHWSWRHAAEPQETEPETTEPKKTKPVDSPLLVYEPGRSGPCDRFAPTIASRPPLTEPYFGWWGWIAALALLALIVAWVSFGARKLFFGDIEEDARRDDDADAIATLPLDRHLGRLGQAADIEWARAEVAPIFDPNLHFSDETLTEWCERCTTRRAVIDRILERTRHFYDGLWKQCSDEEKLLLIQLVEEGYANPKQTEVVRRLLRRGLLRRDPVLRPMNHSFAVFVETHSRPDEVRRKETAHQGLRWSRVRGLLIAALVLILVFLSFTQRDVVEVWIAYLTTAAAGAAGVLKLLSMLSRPSAQKPS